MVATPTHRVVRVGLGARPWPGSLTQVVTDVAALLGDTADVEPLALVVAEPPDRPEQAAALREALRSLVHASVLERPARRVNLVVGGTPADREATLGYLATAEFVVGSTVDLGAAS